MGIFHPIGLPGLRLPRLDRPLVLPGSMGAARQDAAIAVVQSCSADMQLARVEFTWDGRLAGALDVIRDRAAGTVVVVRVARGDAPTADIPFEPALKGLPYLVIAVPPPGGGEDLAALEAMNAALRGQLGVLYREMHARLGLAAPDLDQLAEAAGAFRAPTDITALVNDFVDAQMAGLAPPDAAHRAIVLRLESQLLRRSAGEVACLLTLRSVGDDRCLLRLARQGLLRGGPTGGGPGGAPARWAALLHAPGVARDVCSLGRLPSAEQRDTDAAAALEEAIAEVTGRAAPAAPPARPAVPELLSRALAHATAGRLDVAESLLAPLGAAASALPPGALSVYYQTLSLIERGRGELDRGFATWRLALECKERAGAEAGGLASGWHSLAVGLRAHERPVEAIAALETAILFTTRASGESSAGWYSLLLGNVLAELRRYEEAAEACARGAAWQREGSQSPIILAHLLFNAGRSLLRCGRHREALAPLREAIQLKRAAGSPRRERALAWQLLAEALVATDRSADGAQAARIAAALGRDEEPPGA